MNRLPPIDLETAYLAARHHVRALERELAGAFAHIAVLEGELLDTARQLGEANATVQDLLSHAAADMEATDEFLETLVGQIGQLQAEVVQGETNVDLAFRAIDERDERLGRMHLALLRNHSVGPQ